MVAGNAAGPGAEVRRAAAVRRHPLQRVRLDGHVPAAGWRPVVTFAVVSELKVPAFTHVPWF